MNIQDLTNRIEEICLNHKDVKSFNVGNTWNMSVTKGDSYPAIWVEFPVLVTYSLKQKTYVFSLDVLMMAKANDVRDELLKQSQCEVIADQLLQVFRLKINNISEGRMTGLTVKNINADLAVGIRIDLEFNTNRECDVLNNFIEAMDRM